MKVIVFAFAFLLLSAALSSSYADDILFLNPMQKINLNLADFESQDWSSRQELAAVTPELMSVAQRLTHQAISDEEKVIFAYLYVSSIPYRETRGIQTPQETIENNYGDCGDIAVLFSALLSGAGVDNYVAETESNGFAAHSFNIVVINRLFYKIDATNQGSDDKIFKLFNKAIYLKSKHLYNGTYTLQYIHRQGGV